MWLLFSSFIRMFFFVCMHSFILFSIATQTEFFLVRFAFFFSSKCNKTHCAHTSIHRFSVLIIFCIMTSKPNHIFFEVLICERNEFKFVPSRWWNWFSILNLFSRCIHKFVMHIWHRKGHLHNTMPSQWSLQNSFFAPIYCIESSLQAEPNRAHSNRIPNSWWSHLMRYDNMPKSHT